MGQFEEMTVFAEIARTSSISAAAERLGLAPSVVSRRLKDLEARLETQLFNRTTRSVSLTEPGQIYFEHTSKMLEQMETAKSALSDLAGTFSGKIRMAVPLSFSLIYLSDALSDFLTEHPGICFDIDMDDRRVDLTAEGYDLALRIGDLADSSLMARKIADIPFVVAASPAFIAQHGPFHTPEDMNGLPGLNHSPKSKPEVYSFTAPDGRQGHVTLAPTVNVNSGSLTRDLAMRGKGLVGMPHFIVREALESGALEQLFADYHWGGTALYAVWPPTRHLASRTRLLIDYFADRFRHIQTNNTQSIKKS